MKKIGFTLAEVMIVLVVIGIITGILLPTAIQSTPDKNVMKFKKGYNTLGQVIRELVNSDKYYMDGDLGIRANGELIDGTHEGDNTYFCNTFADVLNTKVNNCAKMTNVYPSSTVTYILVRDGQNMLWDSETETMSHYDSSEYFDSTCNTYNEAAIAKEIVSPDDIIFYQTAPNSTFGMVHTEGCGWSDELNRCLEIGERIYTTYVYKGMPIAYHTICFDVDEANKAEKPFGFGIRHDGKILPGARAKEWLNKSIQKDE